MKYLIVNADDFGFTRDVNQGIVEAHTQGILTATTLMANGAAFDHAVSLTLENPKLDVGCHLVLVGGPSVARPGTNLPASLNELLGALCMGRLPVIDELRAQIERVLQSGLRPSHMDTHKHTHLLPQVLTAVADLAREYKICWVRRPFDFPSSGGRRAAPLWKRGLNSSLHPVRRRFHEVLESRGCRTTDHFAGFQLTGCLRTPELVSLLESLPEGSTEFMCHPGRCTDELLKQRTRLKHSREAELEALTSPQVAKAVKSGNIRLVTYADLAA